MGLMMEKVGLKFDLFIFCLFSLHTVVLLQACLYAHTPLSLGLLFVCIFRVNFKQMQFFTYMSLFTNVRLNIHNQGITYFVYVYDWV